MTEHYTIKELAEAKGTSAPVRAALLALEARVLELEDILIGLRAEVDDLDNPFGGGGAPEMHYGFESAIEKVTDLISTRLNGGQNDD